MTQKKIHLSKKLSLREAHERRMIVERIRRADDLVLAENYSLLLLEEIDKDDMRQAKAILQKLSAIKKASDAAQFEPLSSAIVKAAKDVNEFTGGGIGAFFKKGMSAVAKKLGMAGTSNPLVKSATLLNMLETGFGDFKDVIENNVEDWKWDSDASLDEHIQEDDVKKTVKKNIEKAFQPTGIFGKIKQALKGMTGGGIPYVDDEDVFLNDLMNISASDLDKIIKTATSGPNTEDLQKAVARMASPEGQSDGGSTERGSARPISSTEDLARTIAAGQAEKDKKDPGGAAAAAEKDPKKVTKKFLDFVSKKSKQDPEVVNKVVSALIKAKKLNTELKIAESTSRNDVAVLTSSDVARARRLFLESGGSSRRWVDMLLEDDSKAMIVALNSELETNKEQKKDFIDKLAQMLNTKREDIEARIKDGGLEKTIAAAMAQKPEAVEKAAEAAGVEMPKKKSDLGVKILDNPKVKDKIASVKSKDDLLALLDKIAGAVKAESDSRDGRPVIVERSEERKKQIEAQREKIKKTAVLIKKIFDNPKSADKLLPQVSSAGGLRDKVKELLSGASGGDSSVKKHEKIIAAIKGSLDDENITPVAIAAVLDALPEYLLVAEAARRKMGSLIA